MVAAIVKSALSVDIVVYHAGFEPTARLTQPHYDFQDRSIHPLWQRSRYGYSEEAGKHCVHMYISQKE